MDLTGRFPIEGDLGSQYLLIMFAVGANYIHCEPMPDKTAQSYRDAYTRGHEFFTSHGCAPKYERLDNETSDLFERTLDELGVLKEFPPYQHRANKAERMIRTFKGHLISALFGCHELFPERSWDLLLPQVEITLNLMRASAKNEAVSAYESLIGKFDISKTPLGPPGASVMVLDRAFKRPTWGDHGTIAFYVGPAMGHLRSFTVINARTRRPRVSDSLAWFPGGLHPPLPTDAELIQCAAEDIRAAAKILAQKKIPINEWRNTLVTSGRKIEQYVRLYHPEEAERADLANDLKFDQLWLPDHPSQRSDLIPQRPPNENVRHTHGQKSKNKNKGRTQPAPHNPNLRFHYEDQLQEENEDR